MEPSAVPRRLLVDGNTCVTSARKEVVAEDESIEIPVSSLATKVFRCQGKFLIAPKYGISAGLPMRLTSSQSPTSSGHCVCLSQAYGLFCEQATENPEPARLDLSRREANNPDNDSKGSPA